MHTTGEYSQLASSGSGEQENTNWPKKVPKRNEEISPRYAEINETHRNIVHWQYNTVLISCRLCNYNPYNRVTMATFREWREFERQTNDLI